MKSLLLLCALLALAIPDSFATRPEPQAQINAFFSTLGDKGGAAAVEGLCKGTFLEAQKGSQLAAFPPQLDAAMKIYGKITRIENVDKKSFGESFVRMRAITYHASGAPLFWEFMFFRAKDDWEVYVFQFNDQFERAFSNTP
jgi:hypothetical protein